MLPGATGNISIALVGAVYSDGKAGDEAHAVKQDISRALTKGMHESIHDLRSVTDRETFDRDCWASYLAVKSNENAKSALIPHYFVGT